MTNIYFVRHAKVDYIVDEYKRELSEEGHNDISKITDYFKKIPIDRIYSSPYMRAIQTVQPIATDKNLPLIQVADLRERGITNGYIEDFHGFVIKQWNDFDYKLINGESLNEVQNRGIRALKNILEHNKDRNIIIGTHGTILSLIINYYDKNFIYDNWKTMKMPDIFKICFNGDTFSKYINIKYC